MLNKFEFRAPENGELCVWYKPGSKFHGHTYKCKLEIGTNGFGHTVRRYLLIPIISTFTKVHQYSSGDNLTPIQDTWPPKMLIINNLNEANYINMYITELLRISVVTQIQRNKDFKSMVINKRLEAKQLSMF